MFKSYKLIEEYQWEVDLCENAEDAQVIFECSNKYDIKNEYLVLEHSDEYGTTYKILQML